MLHSLNQNIFWFLYSFAHISPAIDRLIIFAGSDLGYGIGWGLFIAALVALLPRYQLQRRKNLELAIYVAASTFLSRLVVAEGIRKFFPRPRPFETSPLIHKLINETAVQNSFPSGHATFFFAVAAAVFPFYPKTGIFLFFLSLAMGIGRVAAGVHWPIDIVGGAVIGIGSAWLVHTLGEKLLHHKQQEFPVSK